MPVYKSFFLIGLLFVPALGANQSCWWPFCSAKQTNTESEVTSTRSLKYWWPPLCVDKQTSDDSKVVTTGTRPLRGQRQRVLSDDFGITNKTPYNITGAVHYAQPERCSPSKFSLDSGDEFHQLKEDCDVFFIYVYGDIRCGAYVAMDEEFEVQMVKDGICEIVEVNPPIDNKPNAKNTNTQRLREQRALQKESGITNKTPYTITGVVTYLDIDHEKGCVDSENITVALGDHWDQWTGDCPVYTIDATAHHTPWGDMMCYPFVNRFGPNVRDFEVFVDGGNCDFRIV